jgi:hypothetical protein
MSLLDGGDEPGFDGDDAFTEDELRELGRGDPLGTAIDLPTGDATWQLVIQRQTDRPGYITVLLEEGELVAVNDYEYPHVDADSACSAEVFGPSARRTV